MKGAKGAIGFWKQKRARKGLQALIPAEASAQAGALKRIDHD